MPLRPLFFISILQASPWNDEEWILGSWEPPQLRTGYTGTKTPPTLGEMVTILFEYPSGSDSGPRGMRILLLCNWLSTAALQLSVNFETFHLEQST